MRGIAAILLVAVFLAPAFAAANPTTGGRPGPGPREGHTMAYSADLGGVVLYGGSQGGQSLFDAWSWQGKRWRALEGAPALSDPAMEEHGTGVLLIGTSTAGAVETWRLSGSAWTLLNVATGPLEPSADLDLSLVFDVPAGEMVLVGGKADLLTFKTWTLAAGAWAVSTPGPFQNREDYTTFTMPFGQPVIAMGRVENGAPTSQDDDRSGLVWTRNIRPLQSFPPPRYGAAAGLSLWHFGDAPEVHIPLLKGGTDGTRFFNDEWVVTDSGWTPIALGTTPSERAYHSMAWDPVQKKPYLFGGRNSCGTLGDLWVQVSVTEWSLLSGEDCVPPLI